MIVSLVTAMFWSMSCLAAENHPDAVSRVAERFALTTEVAEMVLDQQFLQLIGSYSAQRKTELGQVGGSEAAPA